MIITPLILGRGQAGHALAKSLCCLNVIKPELQIQPAIFLARDTSLALEKQKNINPVLCISNPHGLHANAIQEAEKAGFSAILCEKPACVNLSQLIELRSIKTPTAIMLVYRQTWGIQTLKSLINDGFLGEIITIEGRYWQASQAIRSLKNSEKKNNSTHNINISDEAKRTQLKPPGRKLQEVVDEDNDVSTINVKSSSKSWKEDPLLSGYYDCFLDIGTHWIDVVSHLIGQTPTKINGWRSYANSESPHRDTHIHLNVEYSNIFAFGSISKTYHGASNNFEINVIGTKKSATWIFLKPDEILIGEGNEKKYITRSSTEFGSQQPPFHGLGWLEGYIEIASQLFGEVFENKKTTYPNLNSHLDNLEQMLSTHWYSGVCTNKNWK